MYAYLIKTRGIDQKLVSKMVHNRWLYQDKRNNCVFVSYDEGQPVFASIRGTNTYKKFIADVPGSDYSKGLFFEQGSDKLLICESVIDALSYQVLHEEAEGYDMLALSGVAKKEPAFYRTERKKYSGIVLALDSDDAGQYAAETIKNVLRNKGFQGEITIDLPKEKDWNEEI